MGGVIKELKDDRWYTIAEISLITGVREITLRQRMLKDEPEISFKNGVMSVKGKDAKKLILFRKRGRKPLYIN
jgi:HSP20 family molecular chaperone IbpA